MQSMKHAGGHEAADSACASFYKQPVQPARGKRVHDLLRRYGFAPTLNSNDLHTWRSRGVAGLDHDPAGAVLGEHRCLGWDPAGRIDHHSRRIWPGDVTYGQPRVVVKDCADADDHSVAQRTEPVQMFQRLLPGYVTCVAGGRCDSPVE